MGLFSSTALGRHKITQKEILSSIVVARFTRATLPGDSKMKSFPFLSLLLCAFTGLVMLLPDSVKLLLQYDYQGVLSSEYWRLFSAHWLHSDLSHLSWNVAGLILLGSIVERRSRVLLIAGLLVGMVGVDLLLLSPLGTVQRYCGLSGVLNALLGLVLYCYWRETRSLAVIVSALLCSAKIFIEMFTGDAIFSHISWPPYPAAHLAGLLAAPVALWYLPAVRLAER